MPSCRLPVSLLSTEWDAVKCKRHPRKSNKRNLDALKSDVRTAGQCFDCKSIQSALKDKEIRDFKLAL